MGNYDYDYTKIKTGDYNYDYTKFGKADYDYNNHCNRLQRITITTVISPMPADMTDMDTATIQRYSLNMTDRDTATIQRYSHNTWLTRTMLQYKGTH